MMNNNNYFLLFSNCVAIKGSKRSIIYDLQLGRYKFIPNLLFDVLEKTDNNRIGDIKKIYNNNQNEGIGKYFNLLQDEDFGIECNNISCFSKFSMEWGYPGEITNSIITLAKNSTFDLERIIKELDNLNCESIQFRFYDPPSLKKLKNLFSITRNYKFRSFELIMPFINTFTKSEIQSLYDLNNRIRCIIFSDCNINKKVYQLENVIVNSTNKSMYEIVSSGLCSNENFNVKIKLITESQRHHTYFNRKLCIGLNGEIKNAPECEEEFGYIQDILSPKKLKEIIASPEFQKYWYVHKELCDICKDCEFRHMCVDNRLPYQRKDGSWYHKQECNYNPYIAKWKGEEGYKALEECGVVSTNEGLSIDHVKIASINKVNE